MLTDRLGSFFEHLREYFSGFAHGLYINTVIRTFGPETEAQFSIRSVSEKLISVSEDCLSTTIRPENIAELETTIEEYSVVTNQVGMLHRNRYGNGENSDGPNTRRIAHKDSLRLYRNKRISADQPPQMQRMHMHSFSPIPLESDTFCDLCSEPIYGFGWGPVCQRCAVCHMTCHWNCKNDVRVGCQPISQSKFSRGQILEEVPETTHPTEDTAAQTIRNCVQENHDIQKPVVQRIANSPTAKDPDRGLNPPTSRILRHSTDVGILKRPKRNKLAVRHSFLAGQTSGASLSARLSYDFSSLDQDTIRTHGIRVRDWSPSVVESSISEHSSISTASNQPPLPSQRTPRQTNTDQTCVNGSEEQTLVAPIADSQATPSGTSTSASTGFASVMQTTECFLRSQRQHEFQRSKFSPAPHVQMVASSVGPRSTLPWCEEELERLIAIFNNNEFGLQASKPPTIGSGDCAGQVRIHINLLRPIRMLFTSRPTSIFDVVGHNVGEGGEGGGADEGDTDVELDEFDRTSEVQMTENAISGASHGGLRPNNATDSCKYYSPPKSAVTAAPVAFEPSNRTVRRRRRHRNASKSEQFWVPRGSTKLLHVHLSTTTRSVISALLDRFQIEDNPQKFALYEHTIEGDQEVSVRRLFDDESPLGLLLTWADSNLSDFNQILGIKRLVLQENETGDIEWSRFCVSELKTFLGILNQEEAGYRSRIEQNYERRCKPILRLMAAYERQEGGDAHGRPGLSAERRSTLAGTGSHVSSVSEQTKDQVLQKEDGVTRTNCDPTGNLEPHTDFTPVLSDDSDPDNQGYVESASSVAHAANAQKTDLADVQEGLTVLTVEQTDQKPSKRALQLQAKQQKKAEKERLKAQKKEQKTAKSQTFWLVRKLKSNNSTEAVDL